MIQRILIADDEPLARARVATLLARLTSAELREVGDGPATVAAVRDWAPDVVFLDIQMPGCDGFAVVADVGTAAMPPTVFVTAFDQHAISAFDVAAVDYLLKPFDEDRFVTAWRRVVRAHVAALATGGASLDALLAAAGRAPAPAWLQRFLVRVGERTVVVPVAEVRWLRSDGNYVDLFTPSGAHTIRQTLAQVESRLDPAQFVRIHRRVIVRLDFIKTLLPWSGGDQQLVLRDGTTLRISRTRREAVARRLAGLGP